MQREAYPFVFDVESAFVACSDATDVPQKDAFTLCNG